MTLNGPLKGIYSGDGEYKVDHTQPMQKRRDNLRNQLHILFLLRVIKREQMHVRNEYKHIESSEVYNKEERSNMANKVMFSSQG